MVHLAAAGCRGDDDGVAGLQADQRLEDRGGGGVGRRDDGAHDADGLGDLGDAVSLVALQDTTGLGVLVSVVDVLCGRSGFLMTLSSRTPRPVSSMAIFANGIRALLAAMAAS